jgi:hypothetical protein
MFDQYQIYWRGQYLGEFRLRADEAEWLESWDSFMLISRRKAWELSQEAQRAWRQDDQGE